MNREREKKNSKHLDIQMGWRQNESDWIVKKKRGPSAAECKTEQVLTIVEEEYYEGSLPCFPGRVSWSAFSL